MVPVVIFLFLVCAVLAWSFRVWILIPITGVALITQVISDLVGGTSAATMTWSALVMALVPQFGFMLGLLARYVMFALRAPLAHDHPHSSVAKLYKQSSDSYSVAEVRRGSDTL
ncbi:hypothetical protein [Bradyrhizobium sp. 930_D9_N1_4]|uniref:hypothetical protein n=1 Tax=Bradyrhizobium sp. 930_D9_N1_4 TaxID=3240374 RepID=UPI003F8C9132